MLLLHAPPLLLLRAPPVAAVVGRRVAAVVGRRVAVVARPPVVAVAGWGIQQQQQGGGYSNSNGGDTPPALLLLQVAPLLLLHAPPLLLLQVAPLLLLHAPPLLLLQVGAGAREVVSFPRWASGGCANFGNTRWGAETTFWRQNEVWCKKNGLCGIRTQPGGSQVRRLNHYTRGLQRSGLERGRW